MKVVLSTLTCIDGKFILNALIKDEDGQLRIKERPIKDELAIKWIKDTQGIGAITSRIKNKCN